MSAYLIIAFLFPILSLPFSLDSIRKDFGNWKIYIFLLSSFLAALAYGYTPVNNRPDLVSYFSMAEVLGEMPFLDAVSSSIKGEEYLYLLNILLWIGGKFDLHLIPAISVFKDVETLDVFCNDGSLHFLNVLEFTIVALSVSKFISRKLLLL